MSKNTFEICRGKKKWKKNEEKTPTTIYVDRAETTLKSEIIARAYTYNDAFMRAMGVATVFVFRRNLCEHLRRLFRPSQSTVIRSAANLMRRIHIIRTRFMVVVDMIIIVETEILHVGRYNIIQYGRVCYYFDSVFIAAHLFGCWWRTLQL